MINNQSRTFFITSITYNRQPIFRREPMARLLLEILFAYRDQGLFRVHEFVLMPDHFHMLLSPSEKLSLEQAVQRIKGGFSFRAGKEHDSRQEIWQRSFTHHHIREVEDYRRHRDYILQNPVRARLVRDAREYAYSSARAEFKMDAAPDFAAAKAAFL
ncbi:MAG TPA: transposase [Terriglobales bacterium]